MALILRLLSQSCVCTCMCIVFSVVTQKWYILLDLVISENQVIDSRGDYISKYYLSWFIHGRKRLRNPPHNCSGLFYTYLVGRRTVSQDLLSFQDLYSPKAAEDKNIRMCPKVDTVGEVHYLQSLIVLIIIIGIVDSKPRFKRKR